MADTNLLLTGVTLFLAGIGIIMNWLGPRASVSRQHYYAFVTIFLLILATLPHLRVGPLSPGVFLNLGMMLIILQLSAYFSGTSSNSSRLYAVILVLTAILTSSLTHSELLRVSFGRFIMAGFLWLMLQQFEFVTRIRLRGTSRVVQAFLWLWVLSALASLVNPQVSILPDLFFILLLIAHLEHAWTGDRIISPILSLYGLIIFWLLHLAFFVYQGSAASVAPSIEQILLISFLIILLVTRSLVGKSLSRRYFYLFMAQEVGLLGLALINAFNPYGDLFLLMRFLLFISLNGLFVMIESKAGEGINLDLTAGLYNERPRVTTAVLIIALLLTTYPAIYLPGLDIIGMGLISFLILGGLYLLGLVLRSSITPTNRPYRILRPSLSIWAMVVFIILWSTVTLLETLI